MRSRSSTIVFELKIFGKFENISKSYLNHIYKYKAIEKPLITEISRNFEELIKS